MGDRVVVDSPDTLNRTDVRSAKALGIRKFDNSEIEDSLKFFAENGFVIYRGVYPEASINAASQYIYNYVQRAEKKLNDAALDVQTFFVSQACMDSLQISDLYTQMEECESARQILSAYLGPDIAKIGWDQLWYNKPAEVSSVLVKNVHTDAWTGTSANTIFWKIFLSDVEFSNSLGVCPGSHLMGLVPVLNRAIDERLGKIELSYISLDNIEKGDVVLWHPFLLHFSVGTGKQVRYSITQRYTSLNTPFSSQEMALGYKSISNGPLSYVMRVVGSDYASPFRTAGGVAAIDGRLAKLYPCAPNATDTGTMYSEIFKDL